MSDAELEAHVLSREDYKLEVDILSQASWEEKLRIHWVEATSVVEKRLVWMKKLGETIVLRGFVEFYGAVLHGIMLDAFDQDTGWTEEDKLVTAASVLFMDKKYEPFMTRASSEWRLRLLWDMYHSIFEINTHTDLTRILAASYLLFRPLLWNGNTTSHDIFSVVLQIMEKNRDWDAYDLLQRAVDRFPARYGHFYAALYRFAETYRYDPGIHRGRHHYDVLLQPRSIPSTTVPIAPEIPVIVEDEEPTEDRMGNGHENILDRNLFTDSQNIHTAVVQQGTRKSLEVLCRWYGEYLDKIREIDPHNNVMIIPTVDELIRDISIHFQAETGKGLQAFLHRVETDPSMVVLFESLTDHPTVVVRLWDVLLWVWTYLRSLSDSEELSQRFLEECQETKDTCFSGHMSRLVNTLVGFLPGIESASMDIVETAVIHLQRVIQDMDAEIVDPETDFTTWMIETDTKAPDHIKMVEWVHRHRVRLRDLVHRRLLGSGFEDQEIFPESTDVISDAWDRLFPHHSGRLKNPVESKRCCW